MVQKRYGLLPAYCILLFAVLAIILPFYMSLIVAFKTPAENMHSFFAFPRTLYLGNFEEILSRPGYFRSLFNSFYITIISITGMMLFWPAAAYALARKLGTNKIYRFLYYFILKNLFYHVLLLLSIK